jgi:DNA-binding protein H-NS
VIEVARPAAVRSIVRLFGKLRFEQQKEAMSQLQVAHELSRSAKRAELERQLAELSHGAPNKSARPSGLKKGNGLSAEKVKRQTSKKGKRGSVKAKYRDGKTGETWSGRGRMARWLKAKQNAGEKIEKYLLN